MTFTDDVWARTAPIMHAIYAHDFVKGLGDGSLSRDKFNYYMEQDALYLGVYGRVMARLAAVAPDDETVLWWLNSAVGAIEVERALHAAHVDVISLDATMSPTCQAYTDFLTGSAVSGEYAVGAAAVLPCFWIYADVGEHLLQEAGDLAQHPYGDWIGTYADEAFAQAVREAKALVDAQAAQASPAVYEKMVDAYVTAAKFEWMFWDAAWRCEQWPVGQPTAALLGH